MNRIVINLDSFESVKEFHLWLKEVCQFPEYYGCNLDALHDCISEQRDLQFEILESQKYPEYNELLKQIMLEREFD